LLLFRQRYCLNTCCRLGAFRPYSWAALPCCGGRVLQEMASRNTAFIGLMGGKSIIQKHRTNSGDCFRIRVDKLGNIGRTVRRCHMCQDYGRCAAPVFINVGQEKLRVV